MNGQRRWPWALAAAALLGLAFWGWTTGGLALLQLGAVLC